jgi:hypothetical protein
MPDKKQKHEYKSTKSKNANSQTEISDEYDPIFEYYAHSSRLSPTTFYLSFSHPISI